MRLHCPFLPAHSKLTPATSPRVARSSMGHVNVRLSRSVGVPRRSSDRRRGGGRVDRISCTGNRRIDSLRLEEKNQGGAY